MNQAARRESDFYFWLGVGTVGMVATFFPIYNFICEWKFDKSLIPLSILGAPFLLIGVINAARNSARNVSMTNCLIVMLMMFVAQPSAPFMLLASPYFIYVYLSGGDILGRSKKELDPPKRKISTNPFETEYGQRVMREVEARLKYQQQAKTNPIPQPIPQETKV